MDFCQGDFRSAVQHLPGGRRMGKEMQSRTPTRRANFFFAGFIRAYDLNSAIRPLSRQHLANIGILRYRDNTASSAW
jgi:hypothetical protein